MIKKEEKRDLQREQRSKQAEEKRLWEIKALNHVKRLEQLKELFDDKVLNKTEYLA